MRPSPIVPLSPPARTPLSSGWPLDGPLKRFAPCQAGFTLAEMLIVIIIIISLAGLVIVGVPKIEEVAKAAKCTNNLREIGQSLRLFAVDHNGFYPPLIRPDKFGDPIPKLNDASKTMNPWFYELMRSDTGARYGLDERIFLCPADKNYDPMRSFEELKDKLTYMGDNISYGLNYDVKFLDGTAYKVNPIGDFVDASGRARTPSGTDRNPDYYRADEIADPRSFIVAADGNSEFVDKDNFGISIPIDEMSGLVGARHKAVDRPGGNVLFADDHVEMWASKVPQGTANPTADAAKNINDPMNHRYWTLAGD